MWSLFFSFTYFYCVLLFLTFLMLFVCDMIGILCIRRTKMACDSLICGYTIKCNLYMMGAEFYFLGFVFVFHFDNIFVTFLQLINL